MTRLSRSFRARVVLPCLLAAVVATAASTAPAATPEQVDVALEKSKAFLYSKMKKDDFWEEVPKPDEKEGGPSIKGKQWGGLSAISIYALLAAGENHQEPQLKPALEWIKKQHLVGNYALGLRAQIWTFLPPSKEVQMLAIKDRDYLTKGLHNNPNPRKGEAERNGFYPYYFNDDPRKMHPADGWWDLSVSQYGVLGMWACAQVEGVEVPADYWATVDRAWKLAQFTTGPDSGAWAYRRGSKDVEQEKPKATMTAAGVATLFITQDYLLMYAGYDKCRGGTSSAWIDAGLAWMDKHVQDLLKGDYYGMYGVERIGVASGKKYFGTVDWYDVGSDFLVKAQAKDGSWGGSVQNTCFAMLFLARGRAPVVMNKLEYAATDPAAAGAKLPWMQRPRDVANFARFAGRQSEQYLNWQVVNLKVAPADLHDAPILYIAGSLPLDFTPAEVDKLREFCQAGGMILCNADCGEPAFVQSIIDPQKGLGRKLFPKYEFRELPPSHPIYTDEVYPAKNWKNKPKVLGLSNGVREMVVVIPEADLGRAWQTRAEKTKEEAFQLGMNLFFYAAEKGKVLVRGDTHVVKPDPNAKPATKVRLARVIAGDNPDPEPWAWRRMAALLLNTAGVAVTVEPVKLGEGKLVSGPAGFQVAHLTGTTKFKLSPAQRADLKGFVAGGGTLVVDAAGGSSAFAESAEQELAAMFGGDPSAVGPIIPADDLPYTWTGFKIAKFEYRKFARDRLSGKLNAPRVRGIDQGGKTRVFYSREDLTAAMVGRPCDGIVGYETATGTAIMRNIILYAAYNGRPPRPATAPAGKPAAAAPAAAK